MKKFLDLILYIFIGILFWIFVTFLIINKINSYYFQKLFIFIIQFFAVFLYGKKVAFLRNENVRIFYSIINACILTLLSILNDKFRWLSTTLLTQCSFALIYYFIIINIIEFIEIKRNKKSKLKKISKKKYSKNLEILNK